MTRTSSLPASMSFAVCASMLACGDLQPLLEYETDLPHASESVAGDAGSAESGGEDATSDSGGEGEPGDGDGDGDGNGDGDGDGDGDGEGNPGDGDGAPGDGDSSCGDGVVDDGEECDDVNAASADGCLANCTVPRSCLDLHTFDGSLPDGQYMIAPSYPDPAFQVHCDMTTDGGGWTGLTLRHVCDGHLAHAVNAINSAPTFNFDTVACALYTGNSQDHVYIFDIQFKPRFERFYLSNHMIKANANMNDKSEINDEHFEQRQWGSAYGSNHGDVSFGSANETGPVTSYASTGSNFRCSTCVEIFKKNGEIQTLSGQNTWLRIGWGEQGSYGEEEGWYPWYAGTIFVR